MGLDSSPSRARAQASSDSDSLLSDKDGGVEDGRKSALQTEGGEEEGNAHSGEGEGVEVGKFVDNNS